MNDSSIRLTRMDVRVAIIAAVLAAAAVAGTAYTREGARTVSYLCPDGERFTVEHLEAHVRLRTGSGVFALASDGGDAEGHYSDGLNVLRTSGDRAVLERSAPLPLQDCQAERHAI